MTDTSAVKLTFVERPGFVMFWFIVFIFIIIVSLLVWAISNKNKRLRAETRLVIVENERDRAVETRDKLGEQFENLLHSPVSVEVIYDPAETMERPANPNSSDSIRLVWNLGMLGGGLSHIAGTPQSDIIFPLRLMSYTGIYPNGDRLSGEEPSLLLQAVIQAANQQEELMTMVDEETGFIDQ